MYHRYELRYKAEDQDAAIYSMAAHYEFFSEVTEANYKSRLKDLHPELYAEKYHHKWKELMEKSELSTSFLRVRYKLTVSTY